MPQITAPEGPAFPHVPHVPFPISHDRNEYKLFHVMGPDRM